MSSTGDHERAHDEADQAAWQSIVDNYGDRVELDEPSDPAPAPKPAPTPAPTPEPAPVSEPVFERPAAYDEERFVPPPPPPIPRPEPKRAVAWAGLFVAPLLVLVASVLKYDLAPLVDYALIAWFVGGFVYLVATMSKTPRDPWDDGSRV
ncbi:hypothetical protein [Nocardioides currus]|uniref:Uncharacterized protein n=1 Tax=Nocardioides currus TaxID=2133958 RepID=A0A2R7YW52_9ACTN|nr:hypothetical protein [Nocardioides currus]PUA80598.1 hypothetical protein C7S10_12625 [Nocardioides currus]